MSDNKTNAPKDLTDDGQTVSIGKARTEVAIQAAAEITELCGMMRQATKTGEADLSIRGLSLRAQELSSIIMGALGDEAEKTPDLAYRLTGERVEPVAA